MFLPVVLDFENNGLKFMLLKYLKFLDICVVNDWEILTHQEYEKYEMNFPNRNEYTDDMQSKYGYRIYSYSERMKIRHHFLPREVYLDTEKRLGSKLERAIYYINCRDSILEDYFEKEIEKILARRKIEGVLYFASLPFSLKEICKKKNIPMISYETGPIRVEQYRCNTSYFNRRDLYNVEEIECRWETFKSKIKSGFSVPIFDREELLLMFLADDEVKYAGQINNKPQFEMGVAGGCGIVVPYFAQNKYTDHELIDDIFDEYDYGSVLVRLHPGDMYKASYRLRRIDYSPTPIPFLLQSKRISAVGSNMLFEAMLWKRIACSKTRVMPATLFCNDDYHASKEMEDTELFVNFFIFSFLVPMELAYDPEYIAFRLSNSDEFDIYMKNLEYYIEKFNLSMAWVGLDRHKRKEFLRIYRNYKPATEEEVARELILKDISNSGEEYEREYLNAIINSTSWKLTAPLRHIVDKIRGLV